MKTKLYRVETTFVGADKKSKLYFDNRKKAQDFLYDFCNMRMRMRQHEEEDRHKTL